jgi:hypothetical protein
MINTRLLQTLSMTVLGASGVVALFAPEIFLGAIGMANVTPHWPVQLLAAAWLALANFNWMTRGFTMGGIYGRPVVTTNFTFYLIAAFSSFHPAFGLGRPGAIVLVAVCGILAIAYGLLLFARGPADASSAR